MSDGSTRIYELAKEYKVSSSAMLKVLRELMFQPKSHMSVASPEMIAAVKGYFAREKRVAKEEMDQRAQKQAEAKAAERKRREDERKKAAEARAKARAEEEKKRKPAVDKKQEQKKDPSSKRTQESPRKAVEVRPKKERETRPEQKPEAGSAVKTTTVGGIKVTDKSSKVGGMIREIDKKQRKRARRRKKDRRTVDQTEVAKSFKATMAEIQGGTGRKRYKRTSQGQGRDEGPDNVLEVNEYISLAELAKLMDRKPAELISKLFEMGAMATINQRLDMDTIEMLASEYGFEVSEVAEVGEEVKETESEEHLEPRAPVVTIMGHVDHGKTSLLDYIRHTDVVAKEAGAITQHIGAYQIVHEEGNITFLDTPGHEAFTAMRARGAHVTDIVVLVVAADDGVRPQTTEAIDHARAAGVPIIVAINKTDKPNANPDAIRTQLTEHKLVAEEWGGKTTMVEVSAKTGDGIDKLLEMILLQAGIMDLRADPTIRAQGIIIESQLEKGRGPVVTVLIQKGTCRVGDSVVAGTCQGHIRAMTNERDQRLDSAGPATPVQITGLNGVPQAGDSFMVVKTDQEAKEIAGRRDQVKREHDSRRMQGRVSLDKVFDRIKEGQMKEVRLLIKADVDGSAEVLADTLGSISNEEVRTTIIHRGVGTVTESDVLLAAASNAVIIGFQVSMDPRAREVAAQEHVDVRTYDVIYEAESDVKKALEGLLAPEVSESYVGSAEVRELFRVPKIGVIAGSYVRDGRINRKDQVRVTRDGKTIYKGTIGSLKRFKDDVREVKESFECGIGVENFNDLKVGDIIEAYQLVETARTL